MNNKNFSTTSYRADPGRTPDTTASSPFAHTTDDTASPSPPSTVQQLSSAVSSPGAGRFGELHIQNKSPSPVDHGHVAITPSYLPAGAETSDLGPLVHPSASPNYGEVQEGPRLSRSPVPRDLGDTQLHKVSHESDALSNVAQKSVHDTDNTSSVAVPSALSRQPDASRPSSHHGNPLDLQPQHLPQNFPDIDDLDEPQVSLPVHEAKAKPVLSAATCQAHVSSGMFLQPETHAITEEQLINEVRAIYAGLVMVEKKCIEIDKQQSNNADGLKEVQWQALIALHRTLLHEHHDFFLASNHPAASVVLRKLADKYSMPARMWRYGIHSFLELLRKKLPASLEHMLSYIYMAYSMMTLLLESVPAFERTWIECLGDLARYRMAIEEIDMSERDKWSGVARQWYSKAADKSPEVGRIQHHLAVLARPNLLQQLFYYSKSLTSIQPFTNARDSIALVFGPLLDASKPVNKSNPEILIKFVKVHGLFFRRGEVSKALPLAKSFLDQLDDHIESVGAIFREQGVYISSSNYAAIFDYGQSDSKLFPMFDSKNLAQESKQEIVDAACTYWANPPCQQTAISLREIPENLDLRFHTSDHVASYASHLAFYTLELVLERIGDRDVLPYAHVSLAFLWCTALVPRSMEYIQADVPWARIASFLNSLIKSEKGKEKTDTDEFPVNETSKQLPEDFLIRGLAWSQLYYPEDFFDEIADEEERSVEAPSVVIPRTKRCLWLGLNIAKLNCWIKYDDEQRRFFATSFTEELAGLAEGHQVLSRHNEQHDVDTKMTGV